MAAISSEELHDAWQKVKAMTSLPELAEPKLPVFGAKTHMKTKLHAIQHLITSLEYNYTGTLYFDVNKNRSFKSIVNTAKEILKEALPIQCLEAVFLAAYLTAGLPHLERFPISFKTKAGSSTHRHIILAVHYQQHKWGALGLSRCDKLMNKDVKFDSLSDLVLEYCREFQNVYHKVVKVNVGFPLSHDIHSSEKVEWRVLNLPVDTTNWTEVAKHFDMFAKEAAEIEIFKKAKGELPTWFSSKFALNAPDAELGMRLPRRCSNPLDFPDDFDDLDEAPPPEPTPAESPKEVERPIVVSPDELVFKKPSSSEIPAPPTNVFLQNTTSSPFSIEIEDASGLLEVVTKPQSGLSSLTLQTEDRDEISSETLAKPVSTFRVSAKGMIVVAIKFNPRPTGVGAASPSAQRTERKVATASSSVIPPRTKLAKKGTGGAGSPRLFPDEPAPGPMKLTTTPRQVVSFRCTSMTRVSEDSKDEALDGEAYTQEMPFIFKDM